MFTIIVRNPPPESQGHIEFESEPSTELCVALYKLGFRGVVWWKSDGVRLNCDLHSLLYVNAG